MAAKKDAQWKTNGKEQLDPGLAPAEAKALDSAGGAISKATTANPKDLFGSVKVSFTKVSAIALAHCALAMMDGARKYGPYNWRAKPVIVSIYIDAAMRHMLAYFEGERLASDSHAHHLGHAMACCAILLDAEAHGCLIDDRPNGKAIFSRVLEDLSAIIKQGNDERAAKEAIAVVLTGSRKIASQVEAAAKLDDDLELPRGTIWSLYIQRKHAPERLKRKILKAMKPACRHSLTTLGHPFIRGKEIDECCFCGGQVLHKRKAKKAKR